MARLKEAAIFGMDEKEVMEVMDKAERQKKYGRDISKYGGVK